MKIFVTGASGFIGSKVAENLKLKGYDVYCLVRNSSYTIHLNQLGIKTVVGNLEDPDTYEHSLKDVSYIYHIAGLTSAKSYKDFLTVNKDGVENLLTTCTKVSPNLNKFILVSSLAASGPSERLENPKTELDQCIPITSYGKSKLAGEHVAERFSQDLPITIVRPPAVYGHRDKAILQIFALASKGIGTTIGSNDKRLSLINVNDLADGIILAGEQSTSNMEKYFISSEEFYDWDFLIDLICKSFNKKAFKIRIPHPLVYGIAALSGFVGKFMPKPPILDYEKAKDLTAKYWICSIDKAKSELGFSPKVSIEDGIKSTALWYKHNKWL